MTIRQDIKDAKDVLEGIYSVASLATLFTGVGEIELVAKGILFGNITSSFGQVESGVRDIFSKDDAIGASTLVIGLSSLVLGGVASKALSKSFEIGNKLPQLEMILPLQKKISEVELEMKSQIKLRNIAKLQRNISKLQDEFSMFSNSQIQERHDSYMKSITEIYPLMKKDFDYQTESTQFLEGQKKWKERIETELSEKKKELEEFQATPIENITIEHPSMQLFDLYTMLEREGYQIKISREEFAFQRSRFQKAIFTQDLLAYSGNTLNINLQQQSFFSN